MKSTPRKDSLFLDTSVLVSGLNSQFGASAFILTLWKVGRISLTISLEVITEMEGIVSNKFPHLETPFRDLIASKPKITKQATAGDLKIARKILETEDTPILAGALKSRAEFLITLDKRFARLVKEKIPMTILLPGDYVALWRKQHGG